MPEGRLLVEMLECKYEFIATDMLMRFGWPEGDRNEASLVVAISHVRNTIRQVGTLSIVTLKRVSANFLDGSVLSRARFFI